MQGKPIPLNNCYDYGYGFESGQIGWDVKNYRDNGKDPIGSYNCPVPIRLHQIIKVPLILAYNKFQILYFSKLH